VILESQFELDPKECNIIHLSDNKFYFHPKDGNSLLLGVEGNNGKYLIKRIDSEEIAPGYLFFDIDYSVRLKELLLLTGVKENEANESIKVLRKWKDAIVSFYDMNGKDLEETIKKLQIVKEKNTDLIDSNPSKNNLHYWLDDSEKIALSLPNLKLIARAVENTNIDFTIEDAENTYKLRNKVKGKLNTINANVKNYLQLRLNNTENGDIKNIYNYELNGLKIDVHVYSIVDVTKDNGFFVEYSKTRKILC
jgi:hypothetical protein